VWEHRAGFWEGWQPAWLVGQRAELHRGLSEADNALVITAPCDTPFLSLDLVAQLNAALDANNAELAVAKTGDQPHPVFSLCRTSVLPSLTAFLESGGRKIDLWYSQLKVVEVQFADEAAFRNINTREELAANSGT
jgi:molybdopterin-guanine dinucleotide biosynthesis protein A